MITLKIDKKVALPVVKRNGVSPYEESAKKMEYGDSIGGLTYLQMLKLRRVIGKQPGAAAVFRTYGKGLFRVWKIRAREDKV
jgi:hypothetical protein